MNRQDEVDNLLLQEIYQMEQERIDSLFRLFWIRVEVQRITANSGMIRFLVRVLNPIS